MTRAPLHTLQPQRVLLIKPSALGDVVQTLPILSALRARWPKAHLAWVVNASLAGLLAGHPELDEVIAFPRTARGVRRITSLLEFARRLRRGRYDLAIDLQGLLRSGLMARICGAPRRVGLNDAREGAVRCYTDQVAAAPRDTPALERYRRVTDALGCTGELPEARLGISPAHRAWAAERLASLPVPRLAIHPGAQWETKRWPAEHFAELARRAQRHGAGIVLVGGPDDRLRAAAIARRLSAPLVNLAGATDLLQLAAVAEAADVFLSGDTGPMHLAAAVGTPVVALFTCTSPRRAGPRGTQHRVLATHVPCAASYLRHCGSMACMQDLTPERVWPELADALDRRRGSRRTAAG